MGYRAYKRDSKGRFAGSGGQRRQEARLQANERRTVQRARDITTAAQLGGASQTLRTAAKKAERSAKVNAKARATYKSKRLRGK